MRFGSLVVGVICLSGCGGSTLDNFLVGDASDKVLPLDGGEQPGPGTDGSKSEGPDASTGDDASDGEDATIPDADPSDVNHPRDASGDAKNDANRDASGDANNDPVTCAGYCARVMATCTGENQQYANVTSCLRECQLLPLGSSGASSGNSVACRAQRLSGTPSAADCRRGGPSGGGSCGQRCEAFCDLAMGVCGPSALGNNAPFRDRSSCLTSCVTFLFDSSAPEMSQTNRNTLNCRMYQLQSAFVLGTDFCKFIGAQSTTCYL